MIRWLLPLAAVTIAAPAEGFPGMEKGKSKSASVASPASRRLPAGHPPVAPGTPSPGATRADPLPAGHPEVSSGRKAQGSMEQSATEPLPPGHPPLGSGSPNKHEHKLNPVGTVRVTVVSPKGKGLPRTPVRLMITVHGKPQKKLGALTDASGIARFKNVPIGEHASHTAATPYKGVNYFSSVRFAKGKPAATAKIDVAEKTTSSAGLKFERVHLIVDPTMRGIRITELVVAANTAKATYAGPALRIPLFHGARQLQSSGIAGSYELSGHELLFKGFLRPGRTQLQYAYLLPLTGSFQRKTLLPIDTLNLFMTKPSFRLSGKMFAKVERMKRAGVEFVAANAGKIAAGGTISFSIAPPAGMMAAMAARGGGGGGKPAPQLVKDWRVVVKWLAPLFALVIFFIVVYLAARRDEVSDLVADEAGLNAERDRLLKLLARATHEAAAGSKAAARRKDVLTAKLAAIYRNLDELAARRALDRSGNLERKQPS